MPNPIVDLNLQHAPIKSDLTYSNITSNIVARASERYAISNRRYTGSKASLIDWILGIIRDHCADSISFMDICAGTGCVIAEAAKYFDRIIINDFLYSNNVIYKGFFSKGSWDIRKLEKLQAQYNSLEISDIRQNYYSKNFGGKYFSLGDAKIIGYIRNDIEVLKSKKIINSKEYNILLASLLYSADKISNTVGHYDAYFKHKDLKDKFHLKLINPINNTAKEISIYREDANNLIKTIGADVVYIDPPYNSRQYSRFYHVLETIVKHDSPKLYGTALKPAPENISDYCKTSAKDKLKDLIEHLNCKYIVVSYNNTYNSKSNSSKNKISLEDLKALLATKGDVSIHEKKHKFFNAGKTEFNDHKELLFLVKMRHSS